MLVPVGRTLPPLKYNFIILCVLYRIPLCMTRDISSRFTKPTKLTLLRLTEDVKINI